MPANRKDWRTANAPLTGRLPPLKLFTWEPVDTEDGQEEKVRPYMVISRILILENYFSLWIGRRNSSIECESDNINWTYRQMQVITLISRRFEARFARYPLPEGGETE